MNQEQNNINSQNGSSIINNFQNTNINQPQTNQNYQQQTNMNSIPNNNINENLNASVYNQQTESILVDSKNKSNKKLFLIIGLVAVVLIIAFGIIGFNICKNNNTEQNNTSSDVLVTNQLWNDYQEGKISTDEYVRYNLYAEYDKSLLDKKYSNLSGSDVAIHTDELIEKYYDELSDKTLKYYISQVNLENVTFELNKENEDSDDKVALSDLFIDTVYAKSNKVTNLNKAILSKNGNFVVWYTTTGDSAITKDKAQKVADDIEDTVEKYNSLFGSEFKFESNVVSKGNKYKDQLKILKSENIDAKYLESAMQIYVVDYIDDSKAKYITGSTFLSEAFTKLFGAGDKFGSIAFPYILLRPSSFSNYEDLAQLYNHELFHHYQHNILSGEEDLKISDDPYIVEATANWASSLVTNKTTSIGYLNEWAATARIFSSNLMSDEWAKEHGIGNVGYALFVYLNNYSNFVNNGTQKIIESIYEEDSLLYLEDNVTKDELTKIQETIALNNLSQSYTNKNLLVDISENEYPIKLKQTITDNASFDNVRLNKGAIDYYLLDMNSDKEYEITLVRDNNNVMATLIAKNGNKYELLQTSSIDKTNYIFNTNDYKDEYEKIYIAVLNILPRLKNYYSLTINETEKVEQLEQGEKGQYYTINADLGYKVYLNEPKGFKYNEKLTNVYKYDAWFSKNDDESDIDIIYSIEPTGDYSALWEEIITSDTLTDAIDEDYSYDSNKNTTIAGKKVNYAIANFHKSEYDTTDIMAKIDMKGCTLHVRIIYDVKKGKTKTNESQLLEFAFNQDFYLEKN